jgi:hypothetical protein
MRQIFCPQTAFCRQHVLPGDNAPPPFSASLTALAGKVCSPYAVLPRETCVKGINRRGWEGEIVWRNLLIDMYGVGQCVKGQTV